MAHIDFSLTRRSVLFAAIASLLQTSTLFAGEKQVITVHKTRPADFSDLARCLT
jgi:hypothetical protein